MYYELTEEKKVVNYATVYRIRAIEDATYFKRKKGDLGGFVCKDTILEGNAWVSGEAVVINSKLRGDISVMNNAVVEESYLTKDCHIQNDAHLYKVTGSGIFATGKASIRFSSFEVMSKENIAFLIEDNALVEKSDFHYLANDSKKSIIVRGDSWVDGCSVTGYHIEICKGSRLDYTKVNGSALLFENCREINTVEVTGTEMKFQQVNRMKKVIVNGERLRIQSGVDIEGTTMEVGNSEIIGHDVTIQNCEFLGENLTIYDSVKLENVEVRGKNVKLENHATLTGQPSERILVLSNTEIKECVRIEVNPYGLAPALSHEKLSGDIHILS